MSIALNLKTSIILIRLDFIDKLTSINYNLRIIWDSYFASSSSCKLIIIIKKVSINRVSLSSILIISP